MAKSKKPQLIHGVLLVDKPEGLTSHDIVARLRSALHCRALGHAGTLDPMATGLLVILIGNATKLSDQLLTAEKAYHLTGKLGIVTDTRDVTGETLEQKDFDLSQSQIESAIRSYEGEFDLEVPMYSAIKRDGKKLYELARKNVDLEEIPKKTMKFFDFKDLDISSDSFSLGFSCSKGSYVRSFVHEVGKKLGCGASLSALRRTASLPYRVGSALSLESIQEKLEGCESQEAVLREIQEGVLKPAFIELDQCLPEWPRLRIEGLDEKLLLNGQISKSISLILTNYFSELGSGLGVKIISKRDKHLLALLEPSDTGRFKIKRVFPRR